jgi:cardiolipin synthase
VYPLEADLDVDSGEFQNTIEGVTGMPFVPGNHVEIYNNGDEFYPAMLDAVESAQRSITMENYIFWDGEVGRRFAEAFAEKSRQGVEVKLLLDAIGSATLGKEIFRILAAGGCQLAWFRPIHWYTLHRANRRDHRKSLAALESRITGWVRQRTRASGAIFKWPSRAPQRWRSRVVSRSTGWRPPGRF